MGQEGSIRSTSRPAWETHENFPDQTLLLRSHENFRRVSERLVLEAELQQERVGHGPPAYTQLMLFEHWKSAMHSHEHYEEGKLYPYLRARYSISTASLEAAHRELTEAEAQVRTAFAADSSQEVAQALRAHDRILREHLTSEEELVIPLLLTLEPQEFQDLTTRPVSELLATLGSKPSS